jgi:tRNA A37 N6-isopentenylltransferase MiaA
MTRLSTRPLIVVLGPTASGKSAFAVSLAKALDGEIVSGDSMQVYRGMDIGTGKITPEEAQGIPHHLVDIKDPRESFSVAEFQVLARAAIADIHHRGKIPILAGGTGLYIGAVTDPYEFSSQEKEFVARYREDMRRLAAEKGNICLHTLLAQRDPVTAAAVHPNDVKRVIRALEFLETQGRPISSNDLARRHLAERLSGSAPRPDGPATNPADPASRTDDPAMSPADPAPRTDDPAMSPVDFATSPANPMFGSDGNALYQTRFIGLHWERAQLYRRINERVDAMIRKGWADETARLLESGVPEDAQSMQAIGYRHIAGFLRQKSHPWEHQSEHCWEHCVEQIKTETRRFAKRQLTWFRRNPRIHWIDAESADAFADEFTKKIT